MVLRSTHNIPLLFDAVGASMDPVLLVPSANRRLSCPDHHFQLQEFFDRPLFYSGLRIDTGIEQMSFALTPILSPYFARYCSSISATHLLATVSIDALHNQNLPSIAILST